MQAGTPASTRPCAGRRKTSSCSCRRKVANLPARSAEIQLARCASESAPDKRTDNLRFGAQVVSVNQQAEAAQKDSWRQVRGDHGRDSNGRSEATIATGEALNDSGQQHVQLASSNLFAASGAGARCR